MRFLETIFRHRLIAIVPVLVGLLVAAGYEMAQPRAFTSTADVWVDASTPGQSNSSAVQYTDPSTQQQLVLQELLKSRAFDIAVGGTGGLAAYLGAHPAAETSGLAAIPGLGSLISSSQGSVDGQLATLLPNDVTILPTGPQILAITDLGPTGAIAAGTVTAVIQQYGDEVAQAQTASDQLAVAYYDQQVSQALSNLKTTDQALQIYLAAHPKVPADGTGDATATELLQTAADAGTAYQSSLQQDNNAKLTLEDVANNIGFRVLDQPQAGTSVSITKKVLGGGLAGLVVGIIISLLIMSALTAADRTARRTADVKRALGLDVAGSIGRVGGGTAGVQRSEA
jgi:capsular polysaccharide biosynthesis protein